MPRLFSNIKEAASEIQRDLTKSPPFLSTRVQNQVHANLKTREALNYSFSIEPDGIPYEEEKLLSFAVEFFPEYQKLSTTQLGQMLQWMRRELTSRLYPHASHEAPDKLHPWLLSTMEGNHFSYTYGERLLGWRVLAVRALTKSSDSRRVFIPIYQPLDLARASELTRVPCTLGYHFAIRQAGQRSFMHATHIMRSCDFSRFWITDVWFASRMQIALAEELGVNPGILTQSIVSFHYFPLEEGEEIY